MQIHLSDAQVNELRGLLDGALADLSYEIANTDNWEFRKDLRARRARLEEVSLQLHSNVAA
jgi:hypothetical protein